MERDRRWSVDEDAVDFFFFFEPNKKMSRRFCKIYSNSSSAMPAKHSHADSDDEDDENDTEGVEIFAMYLNPKRFIDLSEKKKNKKLSHTDKNAMYDLEDRSTSSLPSNLLYPRKEDDRDDLSRQKKKRKTLPPPPSSSSSKAHRSRRHRSRHSDDDDDESYDSDSHNIVVDKKRKRS